MVQEPLYLILILLGVVSLAQWWHKRFGHSWMMRLLPTPIFCYVPPTLLTTLGILPNQSAVYDWISQYVLPACLILILMTTDIKGLKKIGRLAFLAIAGSTVTVLAAGIATFFLFRNQIGVESWKAIATLSASWVGGTANELALKQATGLSDALFGPLFIADITIVYVWMTFLMILSGYQKKIDRLLGTDPKQMEAILGKAPKGSAVSPQKISTRSLVLLLIARFGLGSISTWIGSQIPKMGMALPQSTWIILTVTTTGLMMAFTRFGRKEEKNATRVGYFLFYLVLASTGAKAHLLAILKAPLFLAVCFVWMVLHGGLLFLFGRLTRMPSALLATASQANLGGVVSAPIVASTYEPKMATVAVLLALFSYAVGNYTGILLGQFLKIFT